MDRARDPRTALHARQAAFAALVERFEEMAYVTASHASDGPETARDVCQDAFLTAWRMLARLREPAAFGGWLKRLVRTQCSRAARTRRAAAAVRRRVGHEAAGEPGADITAESVDRRQAHRLVRRAVEDLPAPEREAIVRFYFLGESLRTTARATAVTVGTAGKRLYAARLRLRRSLPRGLARAFLTLAPTPAFSRRVRAGVFDEFIGEYRFVSQPERRVIVRRQGQTLVGHAGGQRNVLASPATDVLVPTEFDGEARFERDRRGRILRFVYYEFGRRLGVARKVTRTRARSPHRL